MRQWWLHDHRRFGGIDGLMLTSTRGDGESGTCLSCLPLQRIADEEYSAQSHRVVQQIQALPVKSRGG